MDKYKGTLEVGKQADFIVFDHQKQRIIEDCEIHSKYKEMSIYKNQELIGQIEKTFLRGKLIFDAASPH